MNQQRSRILCFDLARGLAIIGMVLVNYEVLIKGKENGPQVLLVIYNAIEGRAAALFLVLAGIGVSLMTRDLRTAEPVVKPRYYRLKLLSRAIFLFTVGLVNFYFWFPDILHFYALYFILASALITASGWILLIIAISTIGIGLIWFMSFQLHIFTLFQITPPTEIWSPTGMLYHLLFSGYYPIFPVFSLVIFGMWFGRLDIHDARVRRAALLLATILFVLVELTALLLRAPLQSLSALETSDISYLLGTRPLPPVPLYILSSLATSVLVIVLCYYIAEWFTGRKIIIALIGSGQLALTHYLVHMIPLTVYIFLVPDHVKNLVVVFFSGLIFVGFMLVFSYLWLQRYSRGPLEWIMRGITL